MKLSTLPDRRAEHDPHGPAVADTRQGLTNVQLRDRVQAVAEQLRALGVSVGDVVAVQSRNRVEFVALLFAAWRLGASVTPVNPRLTDDEVIRQLADSAARLVVLDDGITTTATVPVLAVSELSTHAGEQAQPAHDDASALALLIYTSGTTGIPKGVMLDHANLDAMAQMGRLALQIGPADRCLLILPLFHVNGIVVSVITPLLAAASVVIADRFAPRAFFDVIERDRPTYFSAVPTIYAMLGALPSDMTPDTSSLRFAICGAAPASAELLSRFETRYGFPVIEGYGLSEGTCASTINPIDGPRRAGTVGKPFPGQQIRIIDPTGGDVPAGTDGQVVIAGPNVMRGYLGRPHDTARTVIDGWLHTGDIGHLDTEGYLTLAGRSKDMIIRGGENIYPREIEDVLSGDPTVLEAAVIGAPDEKWGEVVVAYVAPRQGATIDTNALRALCALRLAGYNARSKSLPWAPSPRTPSARPTKPGCAQPTLGRDPRPPRRQHDEGIRAHPLWQEEHRQRRRARRPRPA